MLNRIIYVLSLMVSSVSVLTAGYVSSANISVSSSTYFDDEPEATIDGFDYYNDFTGGSDDSNRGFDKSGLLHGNHSWGLGMWLCQPNDPGSNNPAGIDEGAWLKYEFKNIYKLGRMWVWNYNQQGLTYRGMKCVAVHYSVDGTNWTKLGDYEFAIADGTYLYAHNTEIDFCGIDAKFVLITAYDDEGCYGSAQYGYGLSEVRFEYKTMSRVDSTCIDVIASSFWDSINDPIETITGDQYGNDFTGGHDDNDRGLDIDGVSHGNHEWGAGMWMCEAWDDGSQNPAGISQGAWIKYDFNVACQLDSMDIWNYNQLNCTYRGMKWVSVHYSIDGVNWTKLGDYQIPIATGTYYARANVEIDFNNVWVKEVVITAHSSDGSYGSPQYGYGLSEVQFNCGADEPYDFYSGRITSDVLDNFLGHSIGEGYYAHQDYNEDNTRMLLNSGAKFIGRAFLPWGAEPWSVYLLSSVVEPIVTKHHILDPDAIIQGGFYEIITTYVNNVAIPAWVFEEFDMTPVTRNFNYDSIRYANDLYKDHWGTGSSVPDISRLETKMWFYYLCRKQIDAGIEAIHCGQVALMGQNDSGWVNWMNVLTRVRAYAATHARRNIVLFDAHAYEGLLYDSNYLVLDFHSFPSRPAETATAEDAILTTGSPDGFWRIYNNSLGGITPSGWYTDSLQYLVELDHFGASGSEGQNIGGIWVWGYDEISWFGHQSESYRNSWLTYALDWTYGVESNCFFKLPGSIPMAVPVGGANYYLANRNDAGMLNGFSQENTIKNQWGQTACDLKEIFGSTNPNGCLYFGRGSLSSFTILDQATTDANGSPVWQPNGSSLPKIWKNVIETSYAGIAAGQVALHPSSTEYAKIRWVSSFSGMDISVKGILGAGDSGSVDFYIIKNDTVSLYNVNGASDEVVFNVVTDVNPGDTIDIAVGSGSDGSSNDDTPLLLIVKPIDNSQIYY